MVASCNKGQVYVEIIQSLLEKQQTFSWGKSSEILFKDQAHNDFYGHCYYAGSY